jgi:asparagine synthetase B (glutamine-hydrolysing)
MTTAVVLDTPISKVTSPQTAHYGVSVGDFNDVFGVDWHCGSPVVSHGGRFRVALHGRVVRRGGETAEQCLSAIVEVLARRCSADNANGQPSDHTRLAGDYSVVIHDLRRQLVYCYSSLTATHGPYYRFDGARVHLGSSPCALRWTALTGAKLLLDTALPALIGTNAFARGTSLYAGVYQVPPGHVLQVSQRHTKLTALEVIQPSTNVPENIEESSEELRFLICQAVQRAIADAQRVWIFASGLDSCVLAAEAAEQAEAECIHWGLPMQTMHKERTAVEVTARHLGLPLTVIDPQTPFCHPTAVRWIADAWAFSPLGAAINFPTAHLPEALSGTTYPDVVLDGVIADSLFSPELHDVLREFDAGNVRSGGLDRLRKLTALRSSLGLQSSSFAAACRLAGSAFRSSLREDQWQSIYPAAGVVESLGPWVTPRFRGLLSTHVGEQYRAWRVGSAAEDVAWSCRSLEQGRDTLMGVLGVRGESPYQDQDLVEFAMGLPLDQKFAVAHGQRIRKVVLRRAYLDVLPPSMIRRHTSAAYGAIYQSHYLGSRRGIQRIFSGATYLARLGLIDPAAFVECLQQQGWTEATQIPHLLRAAGAEILMRLLNGHDVVAEAGGPDGVS